MGKTKELKCELPLIQPTIKQGKCYIVQDLMEDMVKLYKIRVKELTRHTIYFRIEDGVKSPYRREYIYTFTNIYKVIEEL